jgi:hypothetical protein
MQCGKILGSIIKLINLFRKVVLYLISRRLFIAIFFKILYKITETSTTATDHQEPHPHPNPPPEGGGILWVFPTFMGVFPIPPLSRGRLGGGWGKYVAVVLESED